MNPALTKGGGRRQRFQQNERQRAHDETVPIGKVGPRKKTQGLNTVLNRICPLCARAIGGDEAFAEIGSEHMQLRPEIIRIIRAYHRGWLEEQGACLSCWKAYRASVQAMRLLRNNKHQFMRRDGL